ncbi:vacuolar protein sorting-associated protein 26C isoform X2 [Pectinophora gossypiella]|uniref:vacuolar protein sorting-associated protein 26C isoform X2 n=1 Tax=Pectinophora gossypiella TaxID=13191 RepID=UPI00214F12BB|nr:vacuolar protein sorting-associated protein 26C isoform X2 [Pectinophora gossypiella]
MSTSLSINLKRASKVYHEGETIAGVVVVDSSSEARHEGLALQLEGCVSLQFSTKNQGILDAFSNNIRPINLISSAIELAAAGRVPGGSTAIPFELPLTPRRPAGASAAPALLETYHGVFVNVMYTLKATMKRSFLNKPLVASCQFFVQYRPQAPPPAKPVRCEITPATLRPGGGARALMPSFHIYAEIDSTVCALDKPITGLLLLCRSVWTSVRCRSSPSSCSWCASRPVVQRRGIRGTRRRSRTSRWARATCAAGGRCRCTWCCRGSSLAPPPPRTTSR